MSVPTNLIPTKITGLPEYTGTSGLGFVPYVLEGRTYKAQLGVIFSTVSVPSSRLVSAGTGLLGGGALSSDITLSANFSAASPQSLGVASAGTSDAIARGDHVHPAVNLTDTTQTQGALPLGRGGTGGALSPVAGAVVYSTGSQMAITAAGTAGQVLTSGGAGAPVWSSVGTVTSVGLSGGTTGLTVTGSPITTSGTMTLGGTLAVANGGTGTTTQFTTGSVVFAGASGVYSQNNGSFFWDNANARLGIGTATPGARLTVASGSIQLDNTFGVTIRDNVGTAESVLSLTSANNLSIAAPTLSGSIQYSVRNATGIHQFFNGGTERMRITAAGNVGIGTTSPASALNVVASDGFGLEVSPSNAGYVNLQAYNRTTSAFVPFSVASSFIALQTNGITERMRITAAGDVGIGVTAPTTRLDVNGGVRANSLTLSTALSVANGGTGATDAGTARSNLSAAASGAVTGSGLTMATARILGRSTAATGAIEEIAVGSGLSLSAGTLSATGGGGTVTSVSGTGTVNGITLTGTVTTSGSLTLGGTLSGVSLTTQVSGTLPVANGGTGQTSYTDGQLLIGNTATGGLTKATITAGSNITVTNGNGSITIASTAAGVTEAMCYLNADYTLTSTTAVQKIFNTTTNGRVTLTSGIWFFELVIGVTGMSATSGNAKLDLLGSGSAVLAGQLFDTAGREGALNSSVGTTNGLMVQGASGTGLVSAILAGTDTSMRVRTQGIFKVNTGGTLVPSIELDTAAAAVVKAGSYIRYRRLSDSTTYTVGTWD